MFAIITTDNLPGGNSQPLPWNPYFVIVCSMTLWGTICLTVPLGLPQEIFPEFREGPESEKHLAIANPSTLTDYLSEQTKEFLQKAGEKGSRTGQKQRSIRNTCSTFCPRVKSFRPFLILGAPPGYVGYDEGGQLTERVRRPSLQRHSAG